MRLASLVCFALTLSACSVAPTESRKKETSDEDDVDENDDDDEGDEGGKKKKKDKEENEGGALEVDDPCNDGCADVEDPDAEDPVTLGEFSLLGPFGKVSRQPHVVWEKSTGATAYDLLVASDDQCANKLAEKKDLKEPKADLADLATGDVYLCVTAKAGSTTLKAKNDAQKVTVTQGWVQVSSTGIPEQTRTQGMAWTGKKAVVTGGIPPGTNTPVAKVFTYDPALDKWEEITTKGTPPAPMYYPGTVWAGDKVVVWGGYDSSNTTIPHGGTLDLATGEWKTFTGQGEPSSRRGGHTTAWLDNRLFQFGGSITATPTAAVGLTAYSFAGDTWETIAVTGEPPARGYHCSAFAGDAMIVFGGRLQGTTTDANTAFLFDGKQKTWKALATTGAPTARYSPACAFDGAKFYVFGGATGTTPFANGGVYDVKTDTWAALPVPATGGPGPRVYASAVWTGEAMLLWGGSETYNTGTVRDGWLYFP